MTETTRDWFKKLIASDPWQEAKSSGELTGIGGVRPDFDKQRFINLVQRFNQLGTALPPEADVINKRTRASAIATAKVILREMNKTKAQIDAALGIPHTPLSR